MLRLDIGCGLKKEAGWKGIDIRKYPGIDHVMNVGKDPLPYDDDSIDEIKTIHMLEHLYREELFYFIEECWRVLKLQGFLHIEVPKANTLADLINPDHVSHFVEETFGYWQVPGNPEHKDPHGGVVKHHWHIEIIPQENPENISLNMHPNKIGGKYPYVKVTI